MEDIAPGIDFEHVNVEGPAWQLECRSFHDAEVT